MAVEAIGRRAPAVPQVARPVRLPLTEPAPVRWVLIGAALAFLLFFLVLPFVIVFTEALAKGVGVYMAARPPVSTSIGACPAAQAGDAGEGAGETNTERTASTSCSGEKGLCSTPDARSAASGAPSEALIRTTGSCRIASSDFTKRSTSAPCPSGNSDSITMAAGVIVRRNILACAAPGDSNTM